MNASVPGPTTYGHNSDRHTRFKAASPLPTYVVACGMALFRGPDGHLWFAPDAIGRPNTFDWWAAENLAAWDASRDNGRLRDTGYLTAVAELCVAVDAAARADQHHLATTYVLAEAIDIPL